MTLQDAFALFRRFDIYLARRYHPDVNPAAFELMTNINAARTAIMQSYRRPS
jgi:hypothetical protein